MRDSPFRLGGSTVMRRMLAISITAIVGLAPMAAAAQERAGDAALGAVSGALVFGPVGAVAGAVVGYTAGPAISRSWGIKRSEPRPAKRPSTQARQPASEAQASTRAPRTQSASTQA